MAPDEPASRLGQYYSACTKVRKATDLKAGSCVRVITKKDDKTVAMVVESGKHLPAMGHKV